MPFTFLTSKEDKNIRYFHAKASARRRKNSITKLQYDFRDWKVEEQMEDLIIAYFKDLFSTSNFAENLEFLSGLKSRVTDNMNKELDREFTTDEVYQALMQIHLTKVLESMVCCMCSFKNIGILWMSLLLRLFY